MTRIEYTKEEITNNRQQIIEDNMRLVHAVINREIKINKHNPFYEYDDLFQVGCIGLINAVDTYTNRNSFSSYAYTCIKNGILNELGKQNRQFDRADYSLPVDELTSDFSIEDAAETRIMIESFANQLPEKKKDVLNAIISVQEGYSTKETALMRGCHERTLKNKMSLLKREGTLFAAGLTA